MLQIHKMNDIPKTNLMKHEHNHDFLGNSNFNFDALIFTLN